MIPLCRGRYHDISKPFPDSAFQTEAEDMVATLVERGPSAAALEEPLFTAPDEDLDPIKEDDETLGAATS